MCWTFLLVMALRLIKAAMLQQEKERAEARAKETALRQLPIVTSELQRLTREKEQVCTTESRTCTEHTQSGDTAVTRERATTDEKS